MAKKALIIGITGQDGSYLTELLLSKGYEVHGIIRKASRFNASRINHLYVDPHDPNARMFLHYGDISDSEQINGIIYNVKPDEIYHLEAQSHVRASFEIPEYTGNTTGLSTTRLFEVIRRSGNGIKFYRGSSSELYGASAPPSKSKTLMGWEPKIRFDDLVKIMMDSDPRAAGLEPVGEGDRIIRQASGDKWWGGD